MGNEKWKFLKAKREPSLGRQTTMISLSKI